MPARPAIRLTVLPPVKTRELLLAAARGMMIEPDFDNDRPGAAPASDSKLAPQARPKAEALARSWVEAGVGAAEIAGGAVNSYLFFVGRPPAGPSPWSAVLCSRQPRLISPRDPWLRRTSRLADEAAAPGRVVVSSYGNHAYNLTSCLARRRKALLVAVCPEPLPAMQPPTAQARFYQTYGRMLVGDDVCLVSPFVSRPARRSPNRRLARDALVAALADRIMAGPVRPGGNMAAILKKAEEQGRLVNADEPEKDETTLVGQPDIEPLLPPATPAGLGPGPWLFHLTRACPGPWPDQDLTDYYLSLIDGRENAGHSAFDTLIRILTQKRLLASSRLTRGPHKVVSLTGVHFEGLARLVRWRKGLGRWTIEPYGLALDREALQELGARPAVYGDDTVWAALPADQRFRFQVQGAPDLAWQTEQEWRLPGGLDLTRLGRERVAALVSTQAEAAFITDRFRITTVLFPGQPEEP